MSDGSFKSSARLAPPGGQKETSREPTQETGRTGEEPPPRLQVTLRKQSMYGKLSETKTLLPPAIAFVFDQECLTRQHAETIIEWI